MKFGFDVHGVLDTHNEVYSTITSALVAAGHEVHVITGAIQTPELTETLKLAGMSFTHWFSIAQYHIDKGDSEVKFVDGEPWMEDEVWNETKAQYCHEEGIRLLIDDSPVYGKYFDEKNSTIYLLQKDPRRPDFWDRMAELLPRFRDRPEEAA